MSEGENSQSSGTGFWPIPVFLSVLAITAIIVFSNNNADEDELARARDAGLAPIIQATQEGGVIYEYPAPDTNVPVVPLSDASDFSPELFAELQELGIDPNGWSCARIDGNPSASEAILKAGDAFIFERPPWLFVPGGWSRRWRDRKPFQINEWEVLKQGYHYVNATDRFCVRPGGER